MNPASQGEQAQPGQSSWGHLWGSSSHGGKKGEASWGRGVTPQQVLTQHCRQVFISNSNILPRNQTMRTKHEPSKLQPPNYPTRGGLQKELRIPSCADLPALSGEGQQRPSKQNLTSLMPRD